MAAFLCVQCGKKYFMNENDDSACTYVVDGQRMLSRHYNKHHNEHPYDARVDWWKNLRNGLEELHEVVSESYGNTWKLTARLCRVEQIASAFAPKGAIMVLLIVKGVFYWYMESFTKEELAEIEAAGPDAAVTMKPAEHEEGQLSAEWQFEDGSLVGIRFDAFSKTGYKPCSAVIPLVWKGDDPISIGEVVSQDGNICELKSSGSSLDNPEQTAVSYYSGFEPIVFPPLRVSRGDLIRDSNCDVTLVTNKIEVARRNAHEDCMRWEILLTNTGKQSIVFDKVDVDFSSQGMIKPADEVHTNILSGTVVVPGGENFFVELTVVLKHPEGMDTPHQGYSSFWGSLGAFFLRVKMHSRDSDKFAYCVHEYCNRFNILDVSPDDKFPAILIIDDPDNYRREVVKLGCDQSWNFEITIKAKQSSKSIDINQLRSLVLEAVKTGDRRVPVETNIDGLDAFAWVDVALQRVVVVEATMTQGDAVAKGWMAVPDYSKDEAAEADPSFKFQPEDIDGGVDGLDVLDLAALVGKDDGNAPEYKHMRIEVPKAAVAAPQAGNSAQVAALKKQLEACMAKIEELSSLPAKIDELELRLARLEAPAQRGRAVLITKRGASYESTTAPTASET
eukprot:TRINITY_DN7670_c0_g1_i2.p1 TRINITY_DN7670_c0_g1~~TRINITY_DN7670_c0_g1_i2.p1  ORF type:complete len:656 (+),score=162.74 TRINITY_DN7670_c0_g1_i2:114-1970(+)